ncbi:MAG: hypothetical protein M4D85_00335, partial [Actinomycetota bacterium]|nr:hypothetical protein [Actinomycetota bacterium]
MTGFRVDLLGTPLVTLDDVPVSFDTRKATALLAYLAMTGRPQGRDTLAGLLWPDHEQAGARGALRRTLSVLNAATGGDVVAADRATVAVRTDRVDLDVGAFREHATRRGHDHPVEASCSRCLADLEAATALYRDDFMAGFTLRDSPEFDDWRAFQADGLKQQFAGVLELLVRTRVRVGELDAALDAARRWLALDSLHEPAHAMLMRLYAWTGQRSAAIRQYRECVRVLHDELGVPPLSLTTALEAAVRSGRLERPRPPGRAAAPPAADGTKGGAELNDTALPGLPLVGRTRELTLIDSARNAVGGAGHLLVLSGEAGIGKSRLLADMSSTATASGKPVAVIRCHRGEEGLVLGVIADVLR